MKRLIDAILFNIVLWALAQAEIVHTLVLADIRAFRSGKLVRDCCVDVCLERSQKKK